MRSRSGQTLVEFLLSTGLIALTLTGTGWVLRAEWDRARCAYLVFETAHAALSGRKPPVSRVEVRIDETEAEVSGTARCGSAVQKVRLPRLEEIAR